MESPRKLWTIMMEFPNLSMEYLCNIHEKSGIFVEFPWELYETLMEYSWKYHDIFMKLL